MMQRQRPLAGKPRNTSGWKKDRPDNRDKLYSTPFLARLRLAAKASVRAQPGMRVEDQDSIGSCTCNSGSTAAEFVYKKNGIDLQLSRLWLYAKVRQFEGTPLSEDSGAQIRDVMKVLAKYGCPSEASYPYNLAKWTVIPPALLDAEAEKHQVTFYYRCPSLLSIKASIAQGFPVVGGFSCPENMFTDECTRTGIIKIPEAKEGFEGGHAVLFTGYDDATQLLEFQNSWSEQWGDKGYGYLPYHFVKNGLADDFWTIRQIEK